MKCASCAGELPRASAFCPHCAHPTTHEPVEGPEVEQDDYDQPAPTVRRIRRIPTRADAPPPRLGDTPQASRGLPPALVLALGVGVGACLAFAVGQVLHRAPEPTGGAAPAGAATAPIGLTGRTATAPLPASELQAASAGAEARSRSELTVLEERLRSGAADWATLRDIGRLHARLGQPTDAAAWLEAALVASSPLDLPAADRSAMLVDAGVARALAGDPERAAVLLSESMAGGERPPATLLDLGGAQLAAGRPEAALRVLDEALSRDPSLPAAHAARGVALRRLGRADEARSAAQRALAADASSAPALTLLGALAEDAGDLAAARDFYARAARSLPNATTAENLRRLTGR